MKKILVLGTGFVVKPLVDYFIDTCKYKVLVATRKNPNAGKIIDGRALGQPVLWKATPPYEELDNMVNSMDLVVSMLPPRMHPVVAEACIKHGVNMVTTSYISGEMQALADKAAQKGILILMECGEDPGIDHMGAKQMIDQAHSEGGKIKELISYGSGIPSFEHNRNPFGYKFSWSPKGVMLAAQAPTSFIKNGKKIDIPGNELFNSCKLVDIIGLGTFETYGNRDSTRYLEAYGLEPGTDIYRGLLRFPGWCTTMRCIKDLHLLQDTDELDFEGMTYADLILKLIGSSSKEDVHSVVAKYTARNINSDVMKRLTWLGLFSDQPISISKGKVVDVLVDLMLKKMSYAENEKDMIIVHDELLIEFEDRMEKRVSTMRVEGIPGGDLAMSRAVSLPAAIASKLIIEGKINATGMHMPTLPEFYKPILKELESFGFAFEHKVIPEMQNKK